MPRLLINRRGRRNDIRARLFLFAVLVGIMLIPINLAYDAALPVISAAAQDCAESAVSDAVEKCVAECDFSDLTLIEYDQTGSVCRVSCDACAVNAMRSEFTRRLIDELQHNAVRVRVRVGDLTGSPALLGRGPYITVRITGYSAAASAIVGDVTTAGINQSFYTLTMDVSVSGTLILPRGETRELLYTASIPVAQTLVVGGVPDYYTGY